MALPGETIHLGASPICCDCGRTVELQVMRSAAGWYVGTQCDCGPYSRETGYYKSAEDAHAALDRNNNEDTVDFRE